MNFFQKTVSKILGAPASSSPSIHHFLFSSAALGRDLTYDVYLPARYQADAKKPYPVVLFNDGQDLSRMDFARIFQQRDTSENFPSIVAVGIHTAQQRIREYGTARQADYKGRGDLAPKYTQFVMEEFLPHLRAQFRVAERAQDTAFAGFSLGGLSALDIVWGHPETFGAAGIFSGSLWWRSQDVRDDDPDSDRIMHDIIQKTAKIDPNQRFWFQCGTLDEEEDRNNNGIIDSIDDTVDLMRDLREKGIPESHIRYLQIENGRHEPGTWGEAMPDFLRWAFGAKK